MEILPILPIDLARVAASPRPQSATIGTFGYSKPIAKIAKHQRSIGNLGNVKTNCQYCQNCQWSDRSATHQAHAPGMDRYADQIGQSFCLLDRFLQLVFCWRSPPQGRRPGRSGPVGPQEIFLFLKIQHAYTKVLECLTLAL